MQFPESILIVNINACGVERADEVGGSGRDFAAECFKLAGLLKVLVGEYLVYFRERTCTGRIDSSPEGPGGFCEDDMAGTRRESGGVWVY